MTSCLPIKNPFLLLLLWAALFTATALAEPQQEEAIEVEVQVAGENVIVDLSLAVAATRQEVWAVLTDFDHMADFITNLKESRVLSTSANTAKIFQRGSAKYGPIKFPFESTREMWLDPFDKIQSRMLGGNMRKMEGTTQLVDEGAKTRIIYHTDSIPGVWIPPLIGKTFIEHEIREQFREIRNEIIKRKQAPKRGPQLAGALPGMWQPELREPEITNIPIVGAALAAMYLSFAAKAAPTRMLDMPARNFLWAAAMLACLPRCRNTA